MTIDFTELSNFDPTSAFSVVKIGAEAPLLEVELNEMQQIQNLRRQNVVNTLLNSGFINKTTMTLVAGKLTVPADTVIIGGEVITLTEDMTLAVTVGDVVYLAMKDYEVTHLSTIKQDGNMSGGSSITNTILDTRIGSETSRRLQTQLELVKSNADATKTYINVATITGASAFNDNRTQVTTLDSNATVNQASAPSGNTGTIFQILSWITNRIKAITGKTNWYNAPDTTLAAANTHITATTSIHGAVSVGTANKLMIRDASGRAQVAAPSADADIARKDTVNAVQTNLTTHIADYSLQIPYVEASGSANKYVVTLPIAPAKLVAGLAFAVKINVDSTAASTINPNYLGAKAIKKPNGNNITNLKAGSIYTLRYNGTNFIVQGEGGSVLTGNAVVAEVLSGKKFYSNDPETQLIGTMPNNGALGTITPTTSNQSIPAGHTSGGMVLGDADLVAGNILSGKDIFGVAGSLLTGAVIKTIQYGTWEDNHISTKDIAINAVDRSKSILFFMHWGGEPLAGLRGYFYNTTQIKFELTNDPENIRCSWFVIEFESGVSVQYGIGSTTKAKDITINAVDRSKSFVIVSTYLSVPVMQSMVYTEMIGELTSTTNLNLTRLYNSDFSVNYAYQVISFT